MSRAFVALLVALASLFPLGGVSLAQENRPNLTEQYRDAAGRINGGALEDNGGWEKLTYLTTQIGNRISGSVQLERATAWAAETMRAGGLQNVRLQPVKVPHWVRGREYATVIAPVEKPLLMLGLGGSTATPPEGITAPVVVVRSYEELAALGREKIQGKIVLYDVPFTNYTSLCRSKEVQDLIWAEIERVNANFARVETIKRFFLIEQQLTPEDEELTPTMKLKRSFVNTKYKPEIDAMYRAQAA